MGDMRPARALIEELFAAALAAADPARVVAEALDLSNDQLTVDGSVLELRGRLVVVSIGKAAEQMALGATRALGQRIDAGYVITKEGHSAGLLDSRFQVWEAAHPVPNQAGVDASRTILAELQSLSEDALVVALISGGGSALLEAPKEPVALADVALVTEKLLRAGAPIQDLNAVRIPLSAVKGGGMRKSTRAGRFVTLILSDVLGNDPQVVASGPTIAGNITNSDALQVLRKYGLEDEVPDSIREVLTANPAAKGDPNAKNDVVMFVADNSSALDAAAACAVSHELPVEVLWRQREGEAATLGREWVDLIGDRTGPLVLLGGGEATVTVTGSGMGGRNTEFALAAAFELERMKLENWEIASLATDGQDALTGAAGAVVNSATIGKANELGIDPALALAENDSATLLAQTCDLVITGPTGTNVNDIYIAVNLSDRG